MLMGMRFPLDVADVIEIRGVINHSVDNFNIPPQTPDYRQFLGALESAIDTFGIDNKRHVDKLTKILTMMREFHYQHSIESRDKELELRGLKDSNQQARSQSIFYSLGALLLTIFGILVWISMAEPTWYIKLASFVLAYASWDYLHSLSTLAREDKILIQQLNDVMRERIDSLNWKVLIHKLALVLGYKKVSGVNVFLMNENDSGVLSVYH